MQRSALYALPFLSSLAQDFIEVQGLRLGEIVAVWDS